MLALLLLTLVLIAASIVIGAATIWLCGFREWRWWAPAVGYALLLIYFGQMIRIPRHPHSQLLLAIVCTVACAALPPVWRMLRGAWRDLVPMTLLMLLLSAIPFFAFGHTGILGASVSDDMAQHLTTAFWLRTHGSMYPVAAIGGDLIHTGYPLGPHTLSVALVRASGLSDEKAFSAVTLAIPVLTALAAMGIVTDARRGARWALAGVIGLGYLLAAYLAQGSFKELMEALFVLATVVFFVELCRDPRKLGFRDGWPLGLLAAGAVYAYSYGGLLWIVGVWLFCLFGEVIRRNGLWRVIGRYWLLIIGMVAVAAIGIAPESGRIRLFRHSIFGQESLQNKGNLTHAVSPFESLGVWFNGDFRFNPDPRWPTIVFCVLALIGLAGSLVFWWRRRSLAFPMAVIAVLFVWANLALTVNIYNAAKGLVVLTPVVMGCIGAPLALSWSARAADRRGLIGIRVVRVVAVILLAGAVVSSFSVLRSAPVGLGSRSDEFAQMRPIVKGRAVLVLDNDHFAEWELRGASPLFTTNALYAPLHLGMHPAKVGGLPIDVDNYGAPELDKVNYIVTAGGQYRSQIPSNFRLALRTQSYELYHRVGATESSTPYEDPGQPGAIFDCRSEKGKFFLGRYKWAGVLPKPYVSTRWRGSISKPGHSATVHVRLPRGRWDVSLQYLSSTPITITGPQLSHDLPANFGLITSFWPGGTLTSDGGVVTLKVSSHKRSWFGQLLGPPRGMRAPLSPGANPLYQVAFTRSGFTPRRTLARNACGRYVDWFAPAGSKYRGRPGHPEVALSGGS